MPSEDGPKMEEESLRGRGQRGGGLGTRAKPTLWSLLPFSAVVSPLRPEASQPPTHPQPLLPPVPVTHCTAEAEFDKEMFLLATQLFFF